jgi:hypothetical protein
MNMKTPPHVLNRTGVPLNPKAIYKFVKCLFTRAPEKKTRKALGKRGTGTLLGSLSAVYQLTGLVL